MNIYLKLLLLIPARIMGGDLADLVGGYRLVGLKHRYPDGKVNDGMEMLDYADYHITADSNIVQSLRFKHRTQPELATAKITALEFFAPDSGRFTAQYPNMRRPVNIDFHARGDTLSMMISFDDPKDKGRYGMVEYDTYVRKREKKEK